MTQKKREETLYLEWRDQEQQKEEPRHHYMRKRNNLKTQSEQHGKNRKLENG